MPRFDDFNVYLKDAQDKSKDDPVFEGMMKKLGGDPSSSGPTKIFLTVPRAHADWRAMEDAVRVAFDDLGRKSRTPDAMFDGRDVEVKYRPEGFRDVPPDSYGIKRIEGKWYILVSGPIKFDEESSYNAYVIRSSEYYDAVDSFKRASRKFDEADLPSINPNSPTALKDIKSAIENISGELARAIIMKSRDKAPEGAKEARAKMSLSQRVGANRVRFDIKFETLLRSTIRGMLRD